MKARQQTELNLPKVTKCQWCGFRGVPPGLDYHDQCLLTRNKCREQRLRRQAADEAWEKLRVEASK